MLESSDGSQRITTAKLAANVGVSEAAFYRHFPSKTRMFDSLIEFIEDSLMSRINLILQDEKETFNRLADPATGIGACRTQSRLTRSDRACIDVRARPLARAY